MVNVALTDKGVTGISSCQCKLNNFRLVVWCNFLNGCPYLNVICMELDSSLNVKSWSVLWGNCGGICTRMVLRYFPGTTTHLFSTLGDSKLLLQKLCTMGRDIPYGVKHQLFTTGSLQALSCVTVMNQCHLDISLWLLLIGRKLQEKALAIKQSELLLFFCVWR